jgi:hypothetical protein
MSCRCCQSENQRAFGAEINIHFPGLKGLDIPTVVVFPQIAVCLECGCAGFTIGETELRLLAEGTEVQDASAFEQALRYQNTES